MEWLLGLSIITNIILVIILLKASSAEYKSEVKTRLQKYEKEVQAELQKQKNDFESELQDYKQQKFNEVQDEANYRSKLLLENERQKQMWIQKQLQELNDEFEEQRTMITNRLESLKSYEASAIQARVRMYEESNKEKFYTLWLEDDEIEEIHELLSILHRLKNPEPLKKAIFEIYYRQSSKDLINRVVGSDRLSGIYKITYIPTGECYIGQSVDIGSRWQQHIKNGFNIDGAAKGKLYDAMQKYGLHTFKFEVVEYCDVEFLNEKEKYWADYFGAKLFGFSIKN